MCNQVSWEDRCFTSYSFLIISNNPQGPALHLLRRMEAKGCTSGITLSVVLHARLQTFRWVSNVPYSGVYSSPESVLPFVSEDCCNVNWKKLEYPFQRCLGPLLSQAVGRFFGLWRPLPLSDQGCLLSELASLLVLTLEIWVLEYGKNRYIKRSAINL